MTSHKRAPELFSHRTGTFKWKQAPQENRQRRTMSFRRFVCGIQKHATWKDPNRFIGNASRHQRVCLNRTAHRLLPLHPIADRAFLGPSPAVPFRVWTLSDPSAPNPIEGYSYGSRRLRQTGELGRGGGGGKRWSLGSAAPPICGTVSSACSSHAGLPESQVGI